MKYEERRWKPEIKSILVQIQMNNWIIGGYHVLKGEKKNVRRGMELRKKIEHSILVYMCSKFP